MNLRPGVFVSHSHSWDTLALDIIDAGSEPTSEGYRCILSAICIFTRWAIAVPLRTKKATEVGEAIMNHVLCKFGRPNRIITDEGPEFINTGLNYVYKHWCISPVTTGGYRSQANPVERLHRTIHPGLTMLMREFGKDWSRYLQAVVFAYNTSTCLSTGYSPFELLLHRKTSLLHDICRDDYEYKPFGGSSWKSIGRFPQGDNGPSV